LATETGQRVIIFTLDGSDNLTITETDIAGNTIGLGVIVSAVNVPVDTNLVFKVGPTNLSAKYRAPGLPSSQVSTQHGGSGDHCFVFINGNTGVLRPNRAFGGFGTLEVGEGIGVQTAE
jgi:hypothetical protein